MSRTKKQIFGAWGEEAATLFLIKKGYEIIKRNYVGKGGEIDIIAFHKKGNDKFNTLCFIEVKTRSGEFGSAERAVDFKKMQHIKRVAKQYCFADNIDIGSTAIQFEVVAVYGNVDNCRFEHYDLLV